MRLSNDQEALCRTQPSGLFARTLLPRQTQMKIPKLSQTICIHALLLIGFEIFEYSEQTSTISNTRAQAFSVVLLCLPLNTFFEDTFLGRQFGKGSVWRHILTPHCLTPHFGLPPHLCLTPHFDAALFDATFRTATTFVPDATFWRHIVWRHISMISEAPPFVPDATFWRHIVWRHISMISEAPPHLCLMPHFDAALFDATFPSFRRRHHICVWRHILAPHCLTSHFHLAPRHLDTHLETSCFFFHRILAFEMAPRTGCRLERMFRAILAFEMAPRTGCRLECMFRAILALKLEIQNHQYNSSYHGSHSYQVGLGKFTILVL